MKKIMKDNKGFAMTELLVVSASVLLIFSILFANFLPLEGKYEDLLTHTNVTSTYSSFYLRKLYNDILKNDINSSKFIKDSIKQNGYYVIYSKDKELDNTKNKEKIKDVIDNYGIEEAIITNSNTKEAKEKYKKDGILYKYISSITNTNDNEEYKELYKVILKTKEFGYSNSEILTEELSNTGCFVLEYKENGFKIMDYNLEKEGCTTDVIIDNALYTVRENDGVINSISETAFKNKSLKSITIYSNVTSIDDSSFKDLDIDIKVKEKSILDNDSINWCHVLYGDDCIRSEIENGYKYTMGSKEKDIIALEVDPNE